MIERIEKLEIAYLAMEKAYNKNLDIMADHKYFLERFYVSLENLDPKFCKERHDECEGNFEHFLGQLRSHKEINELRHQQSNASAMEHILNIHRRMDSIERRNKDKAYEVNGEQILKLHKELNLMRDYIWENIPPKKRTM